jgi:MSHA biogenesis protein MshQ
MLPPAATSSFRGADTASPIISSAAGGSISSNVVAPSLNVAVAPASLITAHAIENGGASFSTPGGMFEYVDWGSGAGPNGASLSGNVEVLGGTGNTGTRTATATLVENNVAISVAIRQAAGFNHIRIDHTGTALTCSPASVTVRACADANCSAVASIPVNVTLSPSGWSGGDSFTIPANSTAGVVRTLAITTPQTVTLGTSAVSPTPTSGARCFVGASETCALTFADTGFIFSNIANQIAGTTSSGHTLRAVRKSDSSTACTGLFTGNVSVQLASQCLNPTTCAGRQVSINGSAIASNPAAALSSYTAITLNFGANSTASFSLVYPDVGQINLSARYALPGSGSLEGTSNSFVVRPAGFALSAIRRSADLFANPGASTAAGPAFIQAGEPFSATITAVTSSGAATPNFGRESPAEGVRLTASLVGGLGLTANPSLSNATAAGASFSSGASTLSALAWDEVGIISLNPAIADGDYLGAGNASGPASGNVGRFTAHHFDVLATPACGSYSYSGQPFQVSIWARTRGGTTSANHLGSNGFARALTLSNAGSATGFSNNTVAASAFAGGAAMATPRFNFTAPPQPPATLSIRAVDTDLVTSAPPAGVEGSMPVRSGRLRLVNAYGSGQADLPLPIRIESWRRLGLGTPAVYAWDLETADTCTSLGTADFSLSGLHSTPGNPSQFVLSSPSAGAGTATLKAPNAAGTTDVSVELGTLAPWLQFDWTGGGSASNPSARAGFERHRGNRRQIYTREIVGGN